MPSSRRCVFGCVTKGRTVHSFPNPAKLPELFKTWVELGGEQLKDLSVEEIYPKMKVCDIHFIESHRNRNNRLSALAIPTLHLPQSHLGRNDCEASEIIHKEDNLAIDMPIQLPVQESCLESNICDASNSIPTKIDLPIELPIDQELHADLNISLSIEKDSAKHNMDSPIFFSSEQSLSDAVTSIMDDHDYCTRSFGNESTSRQVSGKASASKNIKRKSSLTKTSQENPSKTKKIQGSGKKSLNLTYYKEAEKVTRTLRREILRLRKRCKTFKSRLEAAVKLSDRKALQRVTANMSFTSKIFTNMQFREAKKKPKGRRFTLEEKILSLSFYKRSPKAYTLLYRTFTLPSSKSLKNLLGKIKIAPGINKLIFNKMKNTVADLDEEDRLCILMFDEMSISPQVHYDAHCDELKGFATIGHNKIADHALTFMVRGIKKNYKQPVAYYFTQNLNKIDLKNCIKDVIRQIKSTGLKIVATVCDQSTVNVGAIESLIQDTKDIYFKKGQAWRHDVFYVDKSKIIPLYDVPHLIKGIRNNLITKNLKYVDFEENKEKILKWEYFQQLYEADKSQGELKYLLKITEEHINPGKINKMKVKTATQLFSHSVAVAASHLTAVGELDIVCRQITPFAKMFDNLFDSLNCNSFGVCNGKVFRSGVKRNSPHHKLWQDGIIFLKNMKYLEKKNDKVIEKVVPSIKIFIKTIEGMQAIWKLLHEKYSFDTMLCRNFNQDPIENFFGSVRSLGVRNVSPNTIAFEGAFKSLLLNNFNSSHSLKSNCEEDVSSFLQSVDFLIKENANTSERDNNVINQNEEIIMNEELLNDKELIEGICQKTYVCGWALKKCLKVIKNCKSCKEKLFVSEHIPAHGFIKQKEYFSKNWLCYPSMDSIKYFNQISNVTTNVLKRNLNIKHVKRNIKIFNNIFVNDNLVNCDYHKEILKEMFENLVINVTLYSWCRSVNRILSGKISYDGDDETKLYAKMYFVKHRNYKNKK